ncbi:MAG: sigma 54-interacting transcriptional regulator, partial [Bacteroidales bacterium]
GPYIAVNCGAIPEGTIDSELFGHEKGSFTGALNDRKGYFEYANNGTIFLDEAGELPLATQARLLRVLETGEYMRVGSSKVEKTNVRVVAATNVNMIKAIRDGKFREDLFYRLNTVPIQIPPLRDRGEDILMLFRKFASDFSQKYRMPPVQLTELAKKELMHYAFPGNVRQLKNIAEQISIIETAREITPSILSYYLPESQKALLPVVQSKREESHDFEKERELIYQILFDMKKEVNDLKAIVHELIGKNQRTKDIQVQASTVPAKTETALTPIISQPTIEIHDIHEHSHIDEFTDTEEIHDDSISLEDMEKDAIIRALHKYKGKRKPAAAELKISERTLYRKIKEYGLD